MFDYDVEVQPILNVLLNKSIEQATLEVEEEHELEDIRKFKYEYHKRRQLEDAEWQQEVKREIQRIKQKNKALDNARMKRKQQFETMQKLQCLNIAKNFLSTNFKKSMQYLADKNHWRNTFKDQLNVDFKDWMYNSIAANLENKQKSSNFKDAICTDQLVRIGTEKDPIKRSVRFTLEQREKSRQIESKDKRTVHFLFHPGVPSKISPFARKYQRFREGNLEAFEEAEKEKFDAYVQRLMTEELEDGETNPVVYETMPFFHCELTGGMNRLSFSTADDPFYKTSVAKYYPEAIVVGQDGTILAKVNPDERKSADFAMTYADDIRDPVLKINDDRKIQIQIGAIKEPGTMILLTVREFENKGAAKEGEFDRAWFRLANEETNQTIDYSLMKKLELPEDYQENIVNEEDEEAPAFRNEVTYVHGALYLDSQGGTNRWVFESYKHSFQAKDYKDLPATLAELYARGVSEFADQQRQLADAGSALKKSLEEKKLQAMEAAKKAKAKAKKKGKGAEEDPVEEVETVARSDLQQKEEDFDLFVPASF